MIEVSKSHIHWNYFLALENDLETIARYIEFIECNFKTYSIELAHLLLAASSEIDVVMKELCSIISPDEKASNIDDYRQVIKTKKPELINEKVYISRYGIEFPPWDNWNRDDNPYWWKSYNHVKHQRNLYYNEANLENVLKSLGALLITNFYYYRAQYEKEKGFPPEPKTITNNLEPASNLIKLKDEYYYSRVVY